MQTHSIPSEVVKEAEALLGQEMPEPKTQAFGQWLQSLYEEDAGIAAEIAAHLKRKPRGHPQSPLEQERQRLLRSEALSEWWKRLWNVENQYGEWVPNQKRRIAAGVVGAALAFGLLLWVMGQKPLEETKIQGSLGQIAGVSGAPTSVPLGEDSPLLPKSDSAPALLGIAPDVAPQPAETPAITPSLEGYPQTPKGDSTTRYPVVLKQQGGSPANGLGPTTSNALRPGLPRTSPIPPQAVPVIIRQPGSVLPRAEGLYGGSGSVTSAMSSPKAIGAGWVSDQALGAEARPVAVGAVKTVSVSANVGQSQPANAWQALRQEREESSVQAKPSATPAIMAAPMTLSAWQAVRPDSEGSTIGVGQNPTPSAMASPSTGVQGYGGIAQRGSAAYVKLKAQYPANTDPPAEPTLGLLVQPQALVKTPPNTAPSASSSALPSLQTPTNLAKDFLAGFDPAQPIQATLDTNLLVVEAVGVLVRAVGSDGTVWLGKASLDSLRRVAIGFSEVIHSGRRIPVSAVAYDTDHNLGLEPEFRDEDPTLVQDLLRQGASAANGYLQSLLQSGSTTVSAGATVQDHSAPPLEWQLLGELGKLFTLPQPQNSFVRTARVSRGTPLLIFFQPQESDPMK